MSGAKHTPGPWYWEGEGKYNSLRLMTRGLPGGHVVMDFRRWGMAGAQPEFRVGHVLRPASELFTFEVGNRSVRGMKEARADESVYRYQISGIDHPDARLIAAAPDLLNALFHAVNYIENCETQQGITLGCGDVVRAAITKATGEQK